MDSPKAGYKKEFDEAVRDCEIVEELIILVQAKETPSEQTSLDEKRLSCHIEQQKRQEKETRKLLNLLESPLQP